jgi:hypothetical protein
VISRNFRAIVWSALVWAGFFVAALSPVKAGEAALSPEQIVQKAIERSSTVNAAHARPSYFYDKHTIREDLDSKGDLKDRIEKRYEVTVESGMSYLKLIQVNGETLSLSEQKKQNDREIAERQKMTDAKPGQKGDERENFLTADLVSRYQFTLVERKAINGRDAYVLSFKPKSSDLPNHKLTDRFLNQICGKVWIDAQDFEIARAELHLQSEVALWGGLIGTLRQCNYTLERVRLGDGSWFNHFSHGYFEGRKLLSPMVIRTRSESANFRRVTQTAMK